MSNSKFHYTQLFSTYSIVARDASSGAMGVAVQTHQMSVGRVVPWVVTGVGAIATQSLTNISFGPMGLAMLRENMSAENIIASLIAGDANQHRRQLAVVTAKGDAAAHTGTGCIPHAGHHVGEGYTVQANMMTKETVISAMREAYEGTSGDLAGRMIAALQAAQAEDGDIRGMQSAAIKIVPAKSDHEWETLYDLRVDESDTPVADLARLVTMRRAQHIDSEGHQLLHGGDVDGALTKWDKARQHAPDLEEIAYWQAVTLADVNPRPDSVAIAAQILREHVMPDARWSDWRDLIGRLAEVGLIQREGASEELLSAIDDQ
jgi:uncharacterized Ntn-hydrolase superfamily protein